MILALRLTKINLYKHLGTVNFWIPFLLAIASVYEFTSSLAKMAKYYSIPVNGFSAVFFLTDTYSVLIIFLGILILFSDLPFKDSQQMFLVSRSGKRAWIFSQVLYVILVSILYFAFIFICFCAVLFPNLYFNSENWGKIINTISLSSVAQRFELWFTVPQSVLSDFSPLNGFLYSFGIALFVTCVLGLIILIFNLTVKHNTGVFISGAIIFLYMFQYMNHNGYILYYFSPLNWISLYTADKNGITPYPDILWVITILCLFFVFELIALFTFGAKKTKFILETKEEII